MLDDAVIRELIVFNDLHVLASEDLTGQDDVNDVIFTEPMEV
jgi:hypothetical protein